uniref:Phytanoyl-dioxygenase n=1 Tax=Pyrodinium bahamense TaxID=73915 RepID=A0A7S0FFM3_9DINO|mmetsp:Transcript_2897/g.8062  ORF Transcript_2897/g.8062 Transcript_2897/m.8062 type:complete len:463 (+) Transcript_2897:77-1465(+)
MPQQPASVAGPEEGAAPKQEALPAPPQLMQAAAAVPEQGGSRQQARPPQQACPPQQTPRRGGGVRRGDIQVPMMSPEESAQISVPFQQAEALLRPVLDRYGAAIVTGVASEAECAELKQLFAEDLGELVDTAAAAAAGLAAAGERAVAEVRHWPLASLESLGKMERCQLRGLPQGRFAWAGRLHPRVRRVYELIHGTDKLVSSCDNSFFAPEEHREQDGNRSWPHVDHNMHDASIWDDDGQPVSQWEVFQGLLYVWGSERQHASTTVLWCGSHRDVYEELMADSNMARRGRNAMHFSRLEDMSGTENQRRLSQAWLGAARRVSAPPGSLLLWNSRLVHQGWRGGPRLAQPVCWEPAGRRDERARERKMKMAAMGLPSTHWGSLGIPHTLVKAELPAATAAVANRHAVQLPMKRTLRPVTLSPGVQVEEVWEKLQRLDWMKPLPRDVKAWLEASLDPKILSVL